MKKTQTKNAKKTSGKSAKASVATAKKKTPATPPSPVPPVPETGGLAAPDPAKLTVATFIDRKGSEQKVGWSIREDKIEQFVGEEKFDAQQDAQEAGEKWLASYALADDAERRRMLGWKTTSSPKESTAPATSSGKRKGKASSSPATLTPPALTVPMTKKEGKLSGLDAAALVLAESNEPLRCQAMVDAMLTRGLWQTGGKTPAATLYSAILREINEKGTASRFKKTDRGLFALTLAPGKGK